MCVRVQIVVFDDVDIDVAVEWLMFGIFWTNGQICSATSRAIIHERIAPRVFSRLQELCAKVKACHPLTPEASDTAFIGPVISKQQYDKYWLCELFLALGGIPHRQLWSVSVGRGSVVGVLRLMQTP